MIIYPRIILGLLLLCAFPAIAEEMAAPTASTTPPATSATPAVAPATPTDKAEETAAPAAPATPATPSYKYANNDAEYTIVLPSAPSVSTIWGDDLNIPYLDTLPQNGEVLGEVATLRRVDPDTNDVFDVKITFLKAEPAFLEGLTQEKMQAIAALDFKDIALEEKKEDFSTSTNNTLKWATLSGFSVGKNNRPVYNTEHFLTGQQSILLIKVQYTVENKTFAGYYKTLTDSITYRPL